MLQSKIKILVVCSKNKIRSLTAEQIYINNPRFDIRSAGISKIAKHTVSLKNLDWADIILVMENKHKEYIEENFGKNFRIKVLNIEDDYKFMDSELIELLKLEINNL